MRFAPLARGAGYLVCFRVGSIDVDDQTENSEKKWSILCYGWYPLLDDGSRASLYILQQRLESSDGMQQFWNESSKHKTENSLTGKISSHISSYLSKIWRC